LKTRVDGHPREVWLGKAGEELIEAYTIANMAHGTPLATGEGEKVCGVPGPFLLPVGISSSYHIAKFFRIASARTSADKTAKLARPAHVETEAPVLEGEILRDDEPPRWQQGPKSHRPDIAAVINNALRAAGLIKD
jgi:feruloyl esterase